MTINKAQINNAVKAIPTDVQAGQNSYKIQEQQANHIAMKGAVQTTPGGVVAGFKVLGSDPIEGSVTIDGPQACIATDSIDGVKKSASQTTNINLLSRKAADGSLSIAVTQSTPDGMKKTMEATLKSSPTSIDATISSSSPLPNTATKAKTINIKSELKKVNTDFTQKQTIKLKNPIGSNFANAAPGFSFANIVGTIASIVTGGNPMSSVGNVINDLTSFATDPVSGQKVYTPIITNTGNTNLSQTVTKGLPNNQQIKPTRSPFDMKSNYKQWDGWYTIGMETASTSGALYVFEQITSAEEWETDLINGLAARDITTMSVQWTRTPSDWSATIPEIQGVVTARQDKKYGRKKINANPKAYGLTVNYVIKQDGSVYRGRPITEPVFEEDSRAGPIVSVLFVAGSTEPIGNPDWLKYLSKASISSEQFKSLDIGIQSFLKLVPGGEFVTGSELTGKSKTGPGFDIREYVRTKFGKESVYRDFDDVEVKSSSELAELPTATAVKVEADPSEAKSVSDIKKSSEKFNELDVNTGKKKAFSSTELTTKSTGFANAASNITSNIGAQNSSILSNLVDVAKAVTKPITSLLNRETELTDDIKSAQGTRQDLIERGYKYDKDKGTYV